MVGIGPGHPLDRTKRAELTISQSDVVVGYKPYIDSISDLTAGKVTIISGMRQEIERCTKAVELAATGQVVSLISSGDPGIYGMAGLAIEIAHKKDAHIPIQIVPGVTAASAAAAALGAPLMTDFAVISLSDLLVSWDQIEKRLHALAQSGLVTVVYNPKSNTRTEPFLNMIEIFKKYRSESVSVGIVTNASDSTAKISTTVLSDLVSAEVTMKSVIIICNDQTNRINGFLVAQRGYQVK